MRKRRRRKAGFESAGSILERIMSRLEKRRNLIDVRWSKASFLPRPFAPPDGKLATIVWWWTVKAAHQDKPGYPPPLLLTSLTCAEPIETDL